jgi:MFS family permease
LWGRVSDLYSAKPVFTGGFIALGFCNIIVSFLPDKYSFFVFRAISGVFGAALVPSAFRLIVVIFEPEELNKAFTIYGVSGAIANISGILIAAVIAYIPTHGQGADWRWFFRIAAAFILPVGIASMWLVPKSEGNAAAVEGKWKRMDFVGAFS